MKNLIVDGAVVVLEPAPDWCWRGWNGAITLQGDSRSMDSEGKTVVLEPEAIQSIIEAATGKAYAATGFDDAPGSITSTIAAVDHATLSTLVKVDSHRLLNSETTGTFTVQCVPSQKSGSPPVPDPKPCHTGTWRVKSCGQSTVNTEG